MTFRTRTCLLTAAVAAVLLPAHAPEALGDATAADPHTDKARTAVQAFGSALKGELMQAMQTGGPVAAIEICKTRAPAIAEAVSLEQDADVYRTSLKTRNAENAPNAWQREVLLQFEERKAGGESADQMTWQETVDTPSGPEFRFMQAIPTGALCLNCHGQALAPAVQEKIDALYPDDTATGYSEGDLRGAFVLIEQL